VVAEPSLPSGVVTFLLTDVEGSTRIWEADRSRARMAFARHDALVAEHLASFGGGRPRDQGEGDSAFAVFARASDAVGCALALQRAMYAEAWPEGAMIRVRMALHTGEAELSKGNYKGSAVHRCARLRGLAHGGQIVLSEATAQIVRDQLFGDVTLRDMGVHELRGLLRPEHVYQLCHPELPTDFRHLQSGSGGPRELVVGHEVPLPAPLAGSSESAFVGRQAQLAELEVQWSTANAAGARIMLINGEPGIGKSRLAVEFAAKVRALGATVLFGRCDEAALRPYQPFAEALSAYLRALPADQLQYRLGGLATELGRLVPELSARVPRLDEPAWNDPQSERFRLFEAVATFMAELSSAAPVLLVLDDLQWADAATLLLFRHLARHADLGRVVMLGTYRDESASLPTPFADALVGLDRAHSVAHLRLSGLEDDDVISMLAVAASQPETDARTIGLAKMLREQTEGNPFFIGEVLRELAASGGNSEGGRRWVTDARFDRLEVPSGVRGAVTQRLGRLSESANRVLATAAVIGREFRFELVSAVTDLGEERVLEGLDDAVYAGLVQEVPGTVGVYVFSHSLVRQTLYEGLTKTRRARLHRRVGDVLETHLTRALEPPLAELAYHYCQAAGFGDAAKAIDYARRAGDRATELLAYEDAIRLYQMALDTLDASTPGDDTCRYDLLCAAGDAAWRTSDVASARANFLEAAELARQLMHPIRLAVAALGLGGAGFRPWWTEQGLVDDVLVKLLEEALDLLDRGDSELRVKLLGSLAQQLFVSDADRRQRLADESLGMARRIDDPTTLVQALFFWRVAQWRFSNVHDRLAVSNEAVEIAQALDQRELVMQALSFRLVDRMEVGDIGGADADAAEVDAVARAFHVPSYQWAATLFAAMRSVLEGRFADAEVTVNEGFAVGQRAHPSVAMGIGGAQLGILRREQGRAEEFHGIAAAATGSIVLPWRAARILADLEVGREQSARLEFDEIAGAKFTDVPDDVFRSITLALLAEACWRLGDAERAEWLYALLLPQREQFVLLTFAVAFLGAVSYYLGILALTTRSWDEAADHLEHAMAGHARLGADPYHVRTRLAYARLLLSRDAGGDRAAVRPLIDSTVADAERLGMQGLLREAESLRASLTSPTHSTGS
jgi:class 3 adenylate cyclase